MKKLVKFTLIPSLILLIVLIASPAAANGIPVSTWSAAIAYFNPTGSSGELTVSYYPEDGSDLAPTQLTVNSHYSGTVLVGATPGLEGSAVLSSNFEMPAVYKTAAVSGDPYSVILLEFFNTGQVGSGSFFVPHVQHQTSGEITRIGIQNIETSLIDVNLTFISTAGTLYTASIADIEPQSSEVFKTTEITTTPALPADFDGSLTINATLDGSSNPADVVAAAASIEASSNRLLHSYQGVAAGSTALYVPAVFCNYGREGLDSIFHIQNVSGSGIGTDEITITYYDETGAVVDTYSTSDALVHGQKDVINACDAGVSGKLSAVISHASLDLAAVVETVNDNGLSAAFTTSTNYTTTGGNSLYNLILPYIEWSSSQWDFQSSIYILNTGGGSANVNATFYRRDGTSENLSLTIPQHAMFETNPTLVSNLVNMDHRDFKGAVMITSNQPIMATILVTKHFQAVDGSIQTYGDSYMGFQYIP